MFNVIFRVIIIYIVVIAIMRLMGKRQIGEMEPFELVITLIIADLATIPMAEQTIPLWYGIIPLLVISVIHFAASILTKKSPFMRDMISGKPVIVVDPNGIVFQELKKLNISCEELLEQLRNLDFFDLTDVNYAIIERTGKLTVIPKASAMPSTRKDMQMVKPETDVFYCIVENGNVLKKNFEEMGLLHDVIMSDILHIIWGIMKERSDGISKRNGDMTVRDKRSETEWYKKHLKKIAFCSLSAGGDVYVQLLGETSKNFKIMITEKHYMEKKIKEKEHDGDVISTRIQQDFAVKAGKKIPKNATEIPNLRNKSGGAK